MRTKLTDETSISKLVSEMTLEEKMNVTITATACISYSIEEMGIRPLILADGATGVNTTHIILDFFAEMIKQIQSGGQRSGERPKGNPWIELQKFAALSPDDAKKAAEENPLFMGFSKFLQNRQAPEGKFIAFPSGVNIGATFHPEQAYKIGQAVGTEMRASHLDVCLGPNVDIMRDPLGGRNYEMYGEDPVLVGNTAAAFIQGVQSTGTAACAKHFIANNQETRRQTKDTHVSERTLRELYAKGFEKAVKDGGVKAVMSAYNAVNGVFSSYNKMILTDWLKKEWGFKGIVVSDWGAVTGHNDEAIAAGMDMILHGPNPIDGSDIVEAVNNGTLEEARLDNAVERILKLILWQDEMERKEPCNYEMDTLLKASYETIVDGAVLLKNNQVMPLQKSDKIAFFGNRAKNTMECGSGSTYITTSLHSNVFEECEKLGAAVLDADMTEADTVVYVACAEGGENADRPSMEVDNADQAQIAKVLRQAKETGKKTVVLLNIAAPVDMRDWIQDADAILVVFVPGCMGGKAMADILLGEAVPAGKLPMSFPMRLEDSPASPYPTGELDDIYYSEGIYVGYRWYEKKDIKVQFPFGFGLSYTAFKLNTKIKELTLNLENQETVEIPVEITNVGRHAGSEVIQVYLTEKNPRLPMPNKTLAAYKKVFIPQGDKAEVTLSIQQSEFNVYDPERGWVRPIGEYQVAIGTSSADIITELPLMVYGRNPYCLDANSSLGDIIANKAAMRALDKLIPGFAASLGDHLKLISNEKIGPLLSGRLIGQYPDANQLKGILDDFFEELKKC